MPPMRDYAWVMTNNTTATVHHYSDQSGDYTYTVDQNYDNTAPLLFTVSYNGGEDEQYARMTPWRVQEWDTITECPVDDTLTMIDGGACIYRGIAYSLNWSVSATWDLL